MINLLLILFLTSIFFLDWLFFVMGIGGRVMTWIPEFITILFAMALPLKTALDKQVRIPFKYAALIFFYVAHLIMGFLLNDIRYGTILAGLRIYTKFLPIFLLPLIYPLSKKAFRNLILWIYALTLIQLPVVLWQRFIQFGPVGSGDPMGGTLGGSASGILAIYLISIISFFIAFYFKDQISLPVFLLSAACAFIPITMNETKISSVLLPIAFLFPAFFIKKKQEVIMKVLLMLFLLTASMVVFKVTYDYFSSRVNRLSLIGFWTDERNVRKYSKQRIDPIINALVVAPKGDLRFAVFGRGAGNVSDAFTKALDGKYLKEAMQYDTGMTFPKLMWELGFGGTFLFFMFPAFVFFDAVRLSREPGVAGAYALGMLSFSVFFVASTFYTYTIDSNVLIFMYFFASGQLVRLRMETEKPVEEPVLNAPEPGSDMEPRLMV